MSEKATKQLLIPSYGVQNSFSVGYGHKITGIKDPYSGKIYGNLTYDQLKAKADEISNYVQNKRNAATNSLAGNQLDQPYFEYKGMGAFGIPQPKQTYGQYLNNLLSSIFIPSKDNYVHFDKINESYDMYSNGWNKYFEANYKNPRITEEQNNRQARGKAKVEQQTNQMLALSDLVAGNENANGVKRNVGTGVSSSTFNPFAQLEAGLAV